MKSTISVSSLVMAKGINSSRFVKLSVFFFLFVGMHTAFAQHEVTISSYSGVNISSGYPDTGGTELTDGNVPTVAWPTNGDYSRYVGWDAVNAKFTLNFSGTQQVAAVRLTLADSDGSAGVALPSSMVVDPGQPGEQTISIPNPSGTGVRAILLVLNTPYSGSSLTIELIQSKIWIMLAEVEVFSSVPMDGDFTISNANALSYAVPFAENTGATGKLLKNGNGALTLSGNNTFTGGVIVNTDGSTANSSKVIAGSDAAFGTGTIELNGTTNGTGSTLDLNGRTIGNAIDIELRNTGISGRSLENSNTSTPAVLNGGLTIGGANYVGGAGDITFNGVVSGGLNNDYSFFKQDAGTWTFANTANTFDGFFYLIGGEVEVNTLANDGVASSLGQISSGTNFFKFGFNGSGGGILRYIGTTASTSNRAFRFLGSGTGESNRIEANGASTSATLNLTGTASAERAGTYNFSLSGTNTGDNTYSGVISNGSGLVAVLKDGTGTWRLTGANTYTGGTTINAGRLIGNATSIKGVNVPNNSELELDQATAGTLSSNILGTGAVFKTGAGALTLSGSNSYTGGTTISAGRLIGTSVSSITGNILNNSELEFAQSSNVTFGGAISGTGTLYKTGAGTLTLSVYSSYSGGTEYSAGSLILGNDNALGTGTLTIAGTGLTLSTNAARSIPNAIVLNNDATIATGTHAFTINGGITGTGKLTKTGTGTLTLGGTNTFSGGFTIQGGSGANSIIKATSSDAFGTGIVEILGSSGNTGSTLDLNGQTLTNDITIGNKNSGVNSEGAIKNTDTANPATLNGTVVIGGEIYAGGDGDIIFNSLVTGGLSNIYSIYKMGSGTWRFTNNANTFDGFFYLIGGEVEVTSLANAGQASSLGQVTASQNLLKFGFNGNGGGTLRFVGSAANSSDRAFELMGNAAITNRIEADGATSAANLTLTGNLSPVRSGNYTLALGGDNSGDNTFSGVLSNGSGNLALEKDDAGTWILSGTNTYTGATTINAGKLIINGDHSAATGAITVGNGATLGGVGLMGGTITFQDGSFFNPGTSPGILTAQTGLTLQTGNTFNWELTADESTPANRGNTYDGVDVSGGGLTIQTGVTANLDFTVGVDFTEAFWQSPQQWLVFDNGNPPALNSADIFDDITFTNDANGQALTSVSGLSAAYFYWSLSGNDLYLNYSPTGPPSAITSIATANPSTIATGGTSTITIQLKDANGNNITTGGESVSYVLNTPNLGTPGSFTDNGDGTYTTVFTANAGFNTGDEVITFTLNGTNFTNTLTITIVDQVLSGAQVLDGTSGNTQITDIFTTDGNLSLSQGFFVDYLIVGGGGSGGVGRGGGGGAGGVLQGTSFQVDPSLSHSITVGAGGGTVTNNRQGLNGANSSALGLTAIGGGGGGGWSSLGADNAKGRDGGSGGGGSGAPGSGGQGTTGQGFAGRSIASQQNDGGGGGGAGAASTGRDGGIGIESFITGSSLWVGGGGGAGARLNVGTAGTGGNGGGGNGLNTTGIAQSGMANTGGGGGGVEGSGGQSGAGGSGLVILRYKASAPNQDIVSTATPSSILGETYQLYQFTAIGSDHSFDLRNATPGATITNGISGSGNLSYSGPGRLILEANNTYFGTSTISGGILQIGNGDVTGSLGSGAIFNNANLVFNRSNTYTLGGGNAISGNGTVEQIGLGTLDLGGITSHAADTWILRNGSISNGTLSGNFTLESGSISAVLGGSGNLTKNTGGTVTLSGNNTYSGTTSVNTGTLIVNGAHSGAGAVTVASGATLKGSGSLSGTTTVNSGATVLAGNSIGTLEFANLTLEGGGNLNWQIDDATGTAGTNWDQLNVSGTLSINANSGNKFNINVWSLLSDGSNGELSNFKPTESLYTWPIITAGSISGFDASAFQINTNPTNGTGGLISPYQVDGFTIISDGTTISLQYDPPAAQTIDGTNNGEEVSNYTTSNTSGSLTLDLGFFADYLIVGGGGSGGVGRGGGGGAGGVIQGNSYQLSNHNYSYTVGLGGSAVTSDNRGNNGGNSTFLGFTALGGGGGGGWINKNGADGASGGGASGGTGLAGNSSGSQGFPGLAINSVQNVGGGGGGAGASATNANGGDGIQSSITGSLTWYAGGGGAGAKSPTAAGAGGQGGGGAGLSIATFATGTATSGMAGTGGGGGGVEGPNGTSGAGGSGVVILRYIGPSILDGTVPNGSGTASGYTVHTFTSSGNFDLSAVDFNARLKATLSGNIVGTGDLIYDSEGRLTLTGSAHTYSGATEIKNGELRVNSDISSSSGVTVDAVATLSGTGILPATTVNGTHSPGNSPGLQTFSSDLTYGANSILNWELATNSIGTRGTDYDGIDVTGNLDFSGATTLNLIFDGTGSVIDWSDTFWDSPVTGTNGWKLFEVTGTISNLSNLTVNVVDWKDSQSAAYSTAKPGVIPSFQIVRSGTAIYLTYEPLAPDATTSTVSASTTGLVKNGGTSTITVQLKDANGNNITAGGETITFDATTLGTIGAVTDNGDGTYTATYTAGANTGTETITPILNGTNFTNTLTITIVDQVLSGAQVLDGTSGNTQITVVFTTDGNLSLSQGFFVDYLIVGGGGGGGGGRFGSHNGGGGGAGEFVEGNKLQLSSLNYSLTVGAGGAGGTNFGNNRGGNGGNSGAFGLIAFGGGGGGAQTTAGLTGGSGGGGAYSSGAAGASNKSDGFGNPGGAGAPGSPYSGGGGGGAGQAGVAGSSSTNRSKGGDGLPSSITGTSQYYAGGGAGWIYNSTASGGLGGGGSSTSTTGNPGSTNTGGGGAGAGHGVTGNYAFGGNGGSGVVIVRYKGSTPNQEIVSNATPTSILSDSYQLYQFTSVGSSNSFDLSNAKPGATLTNAISGSGNLNYSGPGRLILEADNNYSGTTTISDGTLQIGNGAASGSLGTGAIVNNATLAFNRNNTYTLGSSNAISGTGIVEQIGSGTLDLGGITSHAAGTWILRNGSISNGSIAGNFIAESGSISAVMGGSGNLTKNTGGTVTLTGNNTYSGSTTLNAGTLVVNGNHSATSTVNVNSGATLKGSGSLSGTTTVNSGATVLAGNSIGTLGFADLTLEGGGNLNWQIDDATGSAGTDWDQLNVSGTLTINATTGNKFNINVWSLLGDGRNGELANFKPTESLYTWPIITAGSITNFDAAAFQINTYPTNGTGGLNSPYQVDGFTVISDGTTISLQYDPPAAQTIDGTNNELETANYTTSNTSSALTLDLGFFADYLIVGGGGGGGGGVWGSHNGGGGGAGEFVERNHVELSSTNYSLTVGAGGTGGANLGYDRGGNGGNSIAFGLTALGGGGGGAQTRDGLAGGSGGGGAYYRVLGVGGASSAISGFGFNGGAGSGSGYSGGGGGGAGESGNADGQSFGGDGRQSSITGSLTWYAGGGAGWFYNATKSGGEGGGGSSTLTAGNPGIANTGGGGAGGGHTTPGNFAYGGSGGSGVVIVRYAGDALGSIGGTVTSFTGNGTIGENGVPYQVHSFTSSGAFDLSAIDFNDRLKATLSGNILGSGKFVYDSKGILTLTGTGHSYTGATEIKNGELRVNSDITSSSGVTVDAGAVLSGTGTLPATTINGTHSPGNSPGLQTFNSDLTYGANSTLNWELATNSVGTRGTDYDGINVSGNLDFAGATTLNLIFDGTGSGVDWSDTFWDNAVTGTGGWKLFEVTGTTTNLNNLSVNVVDWKDGQNVAISAARAGYAITFALHQDGEDVYLTYDIQATNAALSGLSFAVNGAPGTLDPTFDPVVFQYVGTVVDGTTAVTVTPIAADAGATITVDGTAVTSGNPSGPITLDPGATLIPVVVTAADGVTSLTYNLIISTPLSTNETVVSFTTTGSTTWTAPAGVYKVQTLVVGGGGGGAGRDVGGGGGAGGLVFDPDFSVTPGTSYSITVGAGGAGGTDVQGNRHGKRGSNSVFGSITAQGGGGAAGYETNAGLFKNGGSGGGGAGLTDLAAGTGTSGQGNSGGAGSGTGSNYGGGGGGGAGQTGFASSANPRGKGGDGLAAVTINGITYDFLDLFGSSHGGELSNNALYFAGGGGGAGHRSSGPMHSGPGGLGGGGTVPGTTGQPTPAGNGGAGLPNTGGGGAASRKDGESGGAGGSGVVILRYSVLEVGQNGADQLVADADNSGFVGLRKVGSNTVEMIGNSDFSGVSVDTGTLLMGNNGTTGTVGDQDVQVAANAFFGVNRSDAVTLNNNVFGAGGFVQRGEGITTITNRQTFTGGVTVDGGTLVVPGGTSSGGTGGIVGDVTVNAGAKLEYAGIRAFGYGTGESVTSLTINGGSVGNDFYNYFWNTFPIEMNGGTLILGGDATGGSANQFLSPIITVKAGSPSQIIRADGNSTATLRLRDASDLTVNAEPGSKLFINVPVISASGATDGAANGKVIKNGTGELVLNGVNLYTGATTINEGTLEVNGSINSAITMSSSATLAGSGTVSTVSLRGTVGPGSGGAGTLTTGNVTLAGNTAYTFDLENAGTQAAPGTAGTDWDLLQVNGTLALGSNTVVVNVQGSPGDFSFLQEYTWKIIDANSISGFDAANWTVNTIDFSAFTGNAAWTVEQSGNDIVLKFTPKSIVWPGVGELNGVDLTEVNDNITIDNGKTLTVEIGAPIDYLVVAGGGSGAGRDVGGGGGGGGVLSNLTQPSPSFIYLGAGTYTVTVGAGGQGRNNSDGVNGENSVFGPFTAIGGGGGGFYASYTAPLGGSGGGGGRQGYFGGPGVKGQGFAGGNGSNGSSATYDAGGGGGGAGGPGQTAVKGTSTTQGKGGDGGPGIQINFTGTPTYFAGGGGGAPHRGSSTSVMISGLGGVGGGGNAAPNNSTEPQAGQANTGGGGGASRSTTGNLIIGGNGGSGIVQVRYPASSFASGGDAIAGTGTANGFTIHSFTTTGSSTFEIPASGLRTQYMGVLDGPGNMEFDSPGTLEIRSNQSFTGSSTVKQGELKVNADLTSSSGLTVEAGAVLSGTGALPPLDVYGKHRPGNSPGVQRVHGDATYRSGAIIEWELNSNDAGLRGYDFDGIDVQGDLVFEPGAILELAFDHAGSQVNWGDAFWKEGNVEGLRLTTPRMFTLFRLAEGVELQGLEQVMLRAANDWKDAQGRRFVEVYPNQELRAKLIRLGSEVMIQLDIHPKSAPSSKKEQGISPKTIKR